MLRIAVHNLGDVTIFRCKGRLAFGNVDRLAMAISKQPRFRMAVLDLAEVTAIDAAGMGMLVSLQKGAKASGVVLKLMNLTPRVEDLLELTRLRTAFEICSVPEMLNLLCRAVERTQLVNVDRAIESTGGTLDEGQRVLAESA